MTAYPRRVLAAWRRLRAAAAAVAADRSAPGHPWDDADAHSRHLRVVARRARRDLVDTILRRRTR